MVNMESTENKEKMENINQMTQNTLFVIQITPFGNQMTQKLYFMASMSTVEVMITYAFIRT